MKKIVSIGIIICLLLSVMSGCGKEKTVKWKAPENLGIAESGLVDENDRYELSFDEDRFCVLLKDKKSGYIWSTVPYDAFKEGEPNQNLNSPIFIEFYNPSDGSRMSAKAYTDCIELGNHSAEIKDGKIHMSFYFESAELVVPLTISLADKGLKAEVNTKEIKESGKTELISVSVLPYLCSTPNKTDKSDYIFLPVGSGALMYTDEEVQEFSREFVGEVYGTDGARKLLDTSVETEEIRLPVFGAKNGNEALFAVIGNNSESAYITGDSGNARNGYSTAYATFYIRGYDEIEVERTDFSDALLFSKSFNNNTVYDVTYYPLSGEKASYNGMAEFYRSYLTENGNLNDSEIKQQPYMLNFVGGSLVRDVAVGIPYTRLETVTTLSDVKRIVEELSRKSGVYPSVLLSGFQKDGLEVGRIAGGFDFSSASGGEKAYKSLETFCKKNDISLFTEYNIVQFNNSSNGYGVYFDVARTAGNQLASRYPITKNTRTEDKDKNKVSVLERALLPDALEKLMDKNGYVSGLSLTSLGSIAYSDYASAEYYVKGGMAAQVRELLGTLKKSGKTLNIGEANGYAAELADSITDTPLTNGDYFVFDESVPFYQMVFHGATAMYSEAVNLAENAAALVLRAVESGVSPAFSLTAKRSGELTGSDAREYYGSVYEGSQKGILSYTAETAEYFSLVGDKTIVSHRIVSPSVTETVFSDDIRVLVNHGDETVNAEGIELKPKTFAFGKTGNLKVCILEREGEAW